MNQIRTIIIDDEPLARERIRGLLKPNSNFEIIAECKNGREAVTVINKLKPDLIFLDIQMPKLNGFEVLKELDKIPVIIFVTAFDEYAISAFDINALDYLLKPFDRERFETAVSRAEEKVNLPEQSNLNVKIEKLLKDLNREDEYIKRFVIKSGGRITFINSDDVDWFESEGNYVRLHVGKKTELIRETIKNLEVKLDPEKFIRIHRSAIIKIEAIQEITSWFNNEYKLKLKNGDETFTGKKYKENIAILLN